MLFLQKNPFSKKNNNPSKVAQYNEHQFILANQNTDHHSKKYIEKYRQLLKGLHYKKLVVISKDFFRQDQKRIMTTPFPTYTPPKKNQSTNVALYKIHFMQSSFWIVFNNTRFNVINTAKQLKNKSLSIKSLPKVHVWRDKKGIIWTLDHRRIAAIILAGNIKKISVI